MRFYKSKPFLISLTVAIVLVAVSSLMAWMGLTAPLNNAVATVAMPFQWCADKITDAAQGFVAYFREFRELQEENEQLRRELTEIRDQIHRADQLEQENAYLRDFLSLPTLESQLSVLDAQVIARSSGNAAHIYTLSRGSLQGVAVGMPVITAQGLVGSVTEVGLNWCRVTPVIEINASVGAYDARSGALGIAEGTYELRELRLCRLAYLEEDADIALGDRVITSGYGSVYPQGLVIGTVTEIRSDEYTRTKLAIIEPAVDFANLGPVMIVTDCVITPVDPASVTESADETGEGGETDAE